MGKGDKKTRKGKMFMGSFGVTRPQNKKSNPVVVESTEPVKAAAPKANKSSKK